MKKIAIIIVSLVCLLTMAASGAPRESDGRVNKYVTRSELLMEATRYTGALTPKNAATMWAEGLVSRSAAMQYTVMTTRLADVYAAQLDELDSNWVTGVSSPWVQGYKIINICRRRDRAELLVTLETMTSAGPADTLCAKLTLIREDGFWRIDGISADEGLYPYALYRPPV